MPSTLTALLIFLLAILPGLPGDKIYRTLIGTSQRDKEWQNILRLLGFSVGGLGLYSIVAGIKGVPPPLHIFPNSFSACEHQGCSLNNFVHICFGYYVFTTTSIAE